MSQLFGLIIGIFRMARYGAVDEFNDTEESKEHQFQAIEHAADIKLNDAGAKSRGRNSGATIKSN